MKERIAIVSVHPDDETLGCGGTILRHVAAGHPVLWIIVTSAWEPRFSSTTVAAKAEEVDRVAAAYGFIEVVRLGLPTTRLRELPIAELVEPLESALVRFQPDWLYTIHGGDVHTDHQAVFEALSIILKPFRRNVRVSRILSFETLSSTDATLSPQARPFIPNVFVEIGAYVERKIEIMALFESERQPSPLPRSAEAIRALARWRGSTIGCAYAEAFMLIREVASDGR